MKGSKEMIRGVFRRLTAFLLLVVMLVTSDGLKLAVFAEDETITVLTDDAEDDVITEENADADEGTVIPVTDETVSGVSANDAGNVILSKKADISTFFTSFAGDKKYESSDKKVAQVSKKGILTVKKPGDVTVSCLLKENGAWTKAGEVKLTAGVPKAKVKAISAGLLYKEGCSIDLRSYITDNYGIDPAYWYTKTSAEVAVLDSKTGILTAGSKNGTVTVYAEYVFTDQGEYGKDKLARKIKLSIKIDHRKMYIADAYEVPEGAQIRYTVSDKKIAAVNDKGILSFKKEGSVTVNIQFYEGNGWIYKDTKALAYNMKKISGRYDIESGIAQRELAADNSYTTKEDVSYYIYRYAKLPGNFITKKEAQALGWTGGGLDPYDYGKCIGGDYYSNYEGTLPQGDYRECDIDTLHKDNRGAKRLVYDVSDGDIYYTADHYGSFIQLY